MTGTDPNGQCWRCPATFFLDSAEPVFSRGKPRDAAGREIRMIRCPRCSAVNSVDSARDRWNGLENDTVNRFDMP